ncbi:RRXRR domain-containing protein, partial [Moorena sp. SIO2C4]|uniref:RRXRR domain-containing protein n=1 Tax=Moorena sp. SIO2C4 TaxID=2607824 RepID=UPI0013C9678F
MSTNYVLVLDTNRKPLNPCKPGMARSLLKAGKAAVFKQYPFTIILNKAVDDAPKPVQLKIDPGSKVTGLALVLDFCAFDCYCPKFNCLFQTSA